MLLYLNTAKQLRAQQLRHYVVRRSARALGLRGPRAVRYNLSQDYVRRAHDALTARSPRNLDCAIRSADDVLAGNFDFLHRRRTFDLPDWGSRHEMPLWSFHLQYCGFVEDLAWAFRWTKRQEYLTRLQSLTSSWIAAPKPLASDAWAPYAVAQRLLHWSRAFLLVHDALEPPFAARWLGSIASQTDYLRRNTEWDLLGNHVHQNLCGILSGAALFTDRHFVVARASAMGRLWQQLDEQVMADGMHSERSPMYHAQVMENTLEAVAVATQLRTTVPSRVHAQIESMSGALARFVRPDGTWHLFNDAANDPKRVAMPRHTHHGAWSLPDSGYFGYSSPEMRFIIDCGEPGPSYQAGHGHCDLLSFELDVAGEPFIVDSGTSGYDRDPLRAYMRSTRAHNTVQLDDGEQQEIWGTFRMARRATVHAAAIENGVDARFQGSYSPFYSARVRHTRIVQLSRDRMSVEDQVAGSNGREVRSFIHFHPSVQLRVDGMRVVATATAAHASIELMNVAALRVVRGARNPHQGWYAPEFGLAIAAPTLELIVADRERTFGYTISTDRS